MPLPHDYFNDVDPLTLVVEDIADAGDIERQVEEYDQYQEWVIEQRSHRAGY